jgi:hypothetical protein
MAEREPVSYTQEDVDQLIRDVTAVVPPPPPEPIPPWEADNFSLQLFPEEAPTDIQRYHARKFIAGTLFQAVSIDTHWQTDRRVYL